MSTQTLLARLAPEPDESFLSLLCRLAKQNQYPSSRVLKALCIDLLDPPLGVLTDMAWLAPPDDLLNAVSNLIGLTLPQICAMTAHRFKHTLTLFNIGEDVTHPLLDSASTRASLNPVTAARYCPQCLKESAHHRVTWLPRSICVCLSHASFLRDTCPNCGERVSIDCIVNDRCSHCNRRLSVTKVKSADDSILITQRLIHVWLNLITIEPVEYQRLTASMPPCSMAIRYELACGLWRGTRLRTPVVESTCADLIVTTAHQWQQILFVLNDWPNRFIRFLHQQSNQHRSHLGLGALYDKWLNDRWRHPAFDFVQDAFEVFLKQAYNTRPSQAWQLPHFRNNPELRDQCEAISSSDTAGLLKAPEQLVQSLPNTGRLTPIYPALAPGQSAQMYPTQMFVRTQARFLAGELPEWLDIEQTARFLGCSETLVAELTEDQTLPAQLNPRQINRSAIMGLVAGLHRWSPDLSPRACDTSIAAAVSNLQAVGLGVCALFQRLISGQLPFWLCHRGHLLFLQDSLVDGDALTCWITDVKSEHQWLSICEVAREVHSSPRCVMAWIEAGVITLKAAFGDDEYLDPSVIQRLTVDLLHGRSTKNWLGIPFRTLKNWIDMQWITPVFVDLHGRIDHFLFNRLDVEQLFSRVHQTRQLFINARMSARWIDDAIAHARIKLLPFDQSPHTQDWHTLLAA